MADPAELSPTELDELEDSLEQLEATVVLGGTPGVRRRLDEFRHIVALSRSAMPMVEVPAGLLDGVLAQARAAAEVPTIAPSPVASTPVPGFWSRMRRFALLPGVALAGAATAVLLMVERAPKEDVAAAPTVEVAQAKRDESPAKGRAAADALSLDPAAAAVESAPPPPATAAPAAAPPMPTTGLVKETPTEVELDPPAEENAEKQADAKPENDLAEAGGKGFADGELDDRTEQEKKSAKPGSAPADPASAADPDMPRWDIIARGDRARHRGDCRVARNEYALALADADARVRARAHAGLGLCDAADGDRTSADAAYGAARELDAEIVTFIEDERPRSGGGASTPKAAAKAKPRAKKQASSDNAGL